jgi:hypothetical protein
VPLEERAHHPFHLAALDPEGHLLVVVEAVDGRHR